MTIRPHGCTCTTLRIHSEHGLHRVGLRPHVDFQRRRLGPWLGQPPPRRGRCGAWRVLLWRATAHQRGQRQRQRRPVACRPGPPVSQHRCGPVRRHPGELVRRGEYRAGGGAAAHRQLRRLGVSHRSGVHGLKPCARGLQGRFESASGWP